MNFRSFFAGIFLSLVASYVTGCGDIGTWKEQEQAQIKEYIDSLDGLNYELKQSGLYYIELVQGAGKSPATGDSAFFKYKGMFLDHTVFDEYVHDTLPPVKHLMGSDNLIAGIDEGLRYMKEGGRARILTPSSLAFGHSGVYGVIPGYTPLVWEIILISVKEAPGK
jgi:FKBP-type peptidyl-prolyl cis-trans isomerase FkpA